MSDKIITIIGPTAIGKTAIAIELAKKLNGEVIGLDSRQIYYGMEIGTAQPPESERNGIRHHLVGIRSPEKVIAAGEYAELVKAVIVDIQQRQKVSIICGGAGLYYRALREGIFEESISDMHLRNKLETEYDKNPQKLLDRLIKIDPVYSKIVHINNKKRLVRALEIYVSTGKAPSDHFNDQHKVVKVSPSLFTVLLTIDRKLLFTRICQRTEQMFNNGLIKEVETLLSRYPRGKVHPLDSIGYKQTIAFLKGSLSYQGMIDEINIRTRQYAKRQLAWFKNEPIDLEINMDNSPTNPIVVEKIVQRLKLSN